MSDDMRSDKITREHEHYIGGKHLMKKKKYNATSLLGLAAEVAAIITMSVYYFKGSPIPRFSVYLFIGGLIITIAGAGISMKDNRK